jgi:hypothetical protein
VFIKDTKDIAKYKIGENIKIKEYILSFFILFTLFKMLELIAIKTRIDRTINTAKTISVMS